MAKKISVCNQKGGVGKTTTTINVGVGLAKEGYRVLLIDTDPQGDLTTFLGWHNQDNMENTLATLLDGVIDDRDLDIRNTVLTHSEGVDVIPANIDLSDTTFKLTTIMNREKVLQRLVEKIEDDYDYILLDCNPSLEIMTINALSASDSVIIPVQAQYLPTKGLDRLLKTIDKVHRFINPDLKVEGILMTLKDERTNMSRDTSTFVRNRYGSMIRVFETEIPICTKAAESTALAKSILSHDPRGQAAAAYKNLTKELASPAREQDIFLER